MGVFQKFFKQNKLNQTTRLYSLYGESANLKYLEDKIDNLPKPDLSTYATKTYVDTQDNALSSRINTNVSNIAQNVNNINNLNTKVNTLNNVAAKLSGVSDQRWSSTNIFDGNTGFGARINMNSNKIINLGTPTSNTDATNKEYVDSKLNNVAKLEGVETQHWTTANVFNNSTTFSADINMFGNKILQVANPVDARDAVNKQYVDDKLSQTKYVYKSAVSTNITKNDIKSGLYEYSFNINCDWIFDAENAKDGDTFLVSIDTSDISQYSSGTSYPSKAAGTMIIKKGVSLMNRVRLSEINFRDVRPGAAGTFSGYVWYRCVYKKI